MERPGPEFLHKKYRDLNTSPEVQDVLEFTKPDETIPPTQPEARIQSYLDFLKGLVDRPAHQERERGIDAIKQTLYARFVITPEEIPEAYFDSVKRRHREEGHGDIEIPEDYRKELAETIIGDQRKSLDAWVDYLASDDAKYPDWLKYYAMGSILRMGRYDKKKKEFAQRTGGTLGPFPDLNREALAVVLGDLEKQYESKTQKLEFTGRHDIEAGIKEKYRQSIENKNFSKLYALAIEEFKPIPEELLKVTEGKWVTYEKGSDHMPLVSSISSYGTGWCLRGEAMAQRYLVRDKNDLHVYYSNDKEGKPTVPRVVMVINAQNKITEVRGVAEDENLDPFIGEVVQKKLAEFPDGKAYEKKNRDMKQLTMVERKVKAGQALTKDDLILLYEINAKIEGFGYQRDPRIDILRKQRNPKEDASILFECGPNQIAWSKNEVNDQTKAYVGPLFPKVFETLGHLEHIYTSFPEGKIRREQIVIGGKDVAQLETEFKQAGMKIYDYAKQMMHHKDFTVLKNPEQANLVRLKVRDLGFNNGATTDQIYAKAQEFGLELCPAEVGPHYRLTNIKQPMGEWVRIAMKQIPDPDGPPSVFGVVRVGGGLWLNGSWAKPDRGWLPDSEFVFRLPPSLTTSASNPKKLGILKRLGF